MHGVSYLYCTIWFGVFLALTATFCPFWPRVCCWSAVWPAMASVPAFAADCLALRRAQQLQLPPPLAPHGETSNIKLGPPGPKRGTHIHMPLRHAQAHKHVVFGRWRIRFYKTLWGMGNRTPDMYSRSKRCGRSPEFPFDRYSTVPMGSEPTAGYVRAPLHWQHGPRAFAAPLRHSPGGE